MIEFDYRGVKIGATARLTRHDYKDAKNFGRRIASTNRKLKRLSFSLKNQAWDLKFRRPARDTLILNEIADDQWRQIWNPRR